MTTLALLLADCAALGIRLLPAGDGGLTIDAPQESLTPELLSRLQLNKKGLLACLSHRPIPAGVKLGHASKVWAAALDRLENDSTFPLDVISVLRTADVQWASAEPQCATVANPVVESSDPDGWPSNTIDPDDLIPCDRCGSLLLWKSLAGTWRCQRCDPPATMAGRGAKKR